MHAEPGEGERRRLGAIADQRTELEHAPVGLELARLAALHDPDLDGHLVEEAEREQLQLVVDVLAAPDRLVDAEADVAILVVGQVVERLRHLDRGAHEILLGQLLGKLLDEVRGERLARLAGLRLGRGQRRGARESQNGADRRATHRRPSGPLADPPHLSPCSANPSRDLLGPRWPRDEELHWRSGRLPLLKHRPSAAVGAFFAPVTSLLI